MSPRPVAVVKLYLLLALTCLTGIAAADGMPPQAQEASARFNNNPRTFDRYDPWCEGHGVDTACQIPGTPFEGGGPGKCERRIHKADYQIELRCILAPTPHMDRGLPDTNWRAEKHRCEGEKVKPGMNKPLTEDGYPCDNQPPVFDRFCKGKEVGQSCTVELSVADLTQNFKGVCRREEETSFTYFRGQRRLTRDTVQCQPAQILPPVELKPVGAWRKLLQ